MNPKKAKEKERRRARKLAEQAWEAADEQNLDLAEKIIRRAVATQPDNPVLWNDQGMLLSLRNKEGEAEEAFRTAISLAPTYAEPYAQLATMKARYGNVQEAIHLLEKASQFEPHVAQHRERLEAYEWEGFRGQCHEAGQTTPTPILLRYGPGGFNTPHRDLRGSVFFPIQMAVVLSPRAGAAEDGADGFRGGEFLLVDVPERKKSRRRLIGAGLGDTVLFCTRDRLVCVGGAHGLQPVKHGVSEITHGTRLVLGVPFHEYR